MENLLSLGVPILKHIRVFLLYFAQKFLYANNVDSNQIPYSAAYELGLHCLHIPKIGVRSKEG